MGVKGGTSDTTTSGNTETETGSATQANSNPTFNGNQAQATLAALTGQATNPQTNANLATSSGALTNAANTGSALPNYSTSPYVLQALTSSDALANTMLQQGEAGIRAQGYRGGTNANANLQGNYAANFANQQALQDAQTQLGQYNTANQTALSGATGLNAQASGQQNIAAQLLAMLRGTSGTSNTQGSSATQSQSNSLNNNITAQHGIVS